MKSFTRIQDIPWSNLSIREAGLHVQKLAKKETNETKILDYKMLFTWLLRGYYCEQAIYNARIAFADSERAAEKDLKKFDMEKQ
jgi:hypothetical protein